jgi:hypothetical protein
MLWKYHMDHDTITVMVASRPAGLAPLCGTFDFKVSCLRVLRVQVLLLRSFLYLSLLKFAPLDFGYRLWSTSWLPRWRFCSFIPSSQYAVRQCVQGGVCSASLDCAAKYRPKPIEYASAMRCMSSLISSCWYWELLITIPGHMFSRRSSEPNSMCSHRCAVYMHKRSSQHSYPDVYRWFMLSKTDSE